MIASQDLNLLTLQSRFADKSQRVVRHKWGELILKLKALV